MAPLTSVDGLVSGLNTTQLIAQIMQVEAAPQALLKSNLSTQQATLAAYQSVNSKFLALQTAAQALSGTTAWTAVKATSNTSSVVATAGASATAGQLTFDVTALAAADTQVSTATYAGTTAQVATGPVSITTGGKTYTVNTSDSTLAGIVAAINASGSGVQAAAVQVSAGQYRLQLTGGTTGAGSAFTVSGLSLSQVTAPSDAAITVGTGPGAYTVSSATNTFTDVLPGLTFTVSAKTTGATITLAADPAGLADKVQGLVDAANAALGAISANSTYDATTRRGGPLLGDSTVRSLTSRVLQAVSSAVGGSSLATVGIQLTRDGSITFDRQKFLDAYAANPATAQNLLSRSGTFTAAKPLTGTVSFVAATDATQAGSYDVRITQAATQGAATLDTSAGIAAGITYTITASGKTATYTTDGTETASVLAQRLGALSASAGLGVSASAGTSSVTLQTAAYGSGATVSVTATSGPAWTSTAGTDVAGSVLVGGVWTAATGSGQVLTMPAGSGAAGGLGLLVTLTPADVTGLAGATAGTLAYNPGLAQRLSSLGTGATDVSTGSLTSAITGYDATIKDLGDQIAAWDLRLANRQAALRQQFANLEVALGKMRDQSSWLAGQIAGLPPTA